MRYLHYRNFYDAYEWHWADGCSRWDILDVVRMTRALRPDGIEWPFAPDGKPANRLEYLTKVNKLDHYKAHDALSDVHATIAVAQLIRDKQPDLFDYMLNNRSKKSVSALVSKGAPFVYTSGRYSSDFLHTTVAVLLAKHDVQDAALVYDLRFDPRPYVKMSVDEIIEAWRWSSDPEKPRLPVKTVKYNRCPAVAPLGVINDEKTQKRLKIDLVTVDRHYKIFKRHRLEFADKIAEAVAKMDKARQQDQLAIIDNQLTVDERLYDGFISDQDKQTMRAVRAASPEKLADFRAEFRDERLRSLLPLYKARNYPSSLTSEEREQWEKFCTQRLMAGGAESRLAKYFARLQELAASKPTAKQQYLLEELQLYGESILPVDAVG